MKKTKIFNAPIFYCVISILIYALNLDIIEYLPTVSYLSKNTIENLVNIFTRLKGLFQILMNIGLFWVLVNFFTKKSALNNEKEKNIILENMNNTKNK